MNARERPLTPAMKRHLRELTEIADGNPWGDAFWQPANSGEWRCAEALARRGLLDRYARAGEKPFGLSEKGLEVGRALNGSGGAS